MGLIKSLAIGSFFLASCVSSIKARKLIKASAFILLDSKYENNIPGYIGGMKSTEYFFKVLITSNHLLHFDSAWINEKRYPIFVSKITGSISSGPVKMNNNDTVVVRVSAFPNADQATPPLVFNGKVLISYKENSKRKYFIIKEVRFQSTPNRQ